MRGTDDAGLVGHGNAEHQGLEQLQGAQVGPRDALQPLSLLLRREDGAGSRRQDREAAANEEVLFREL